MKKIFGFLLALICFFPIYSFEPEKYIEEELQNIARTRSYDYYYDWGEEATLDMKQKCKNPLDLLLTSAINFYPKAYNLPLIGKPRTISEAKLFAKYIWMFQECNLSMKNHDFIIEKKEITLEDARRESFPFLGIFAEVSDNFRKTHPFWDYFYYELEYRAYLDFEENYYEWGKNAPRNMENFDLVSTMLGGAYNLVKNDYNIMGTITSIAEARRAANTIWLLTVYMHVKADYVSRERK